MTTLLLTCGLPGSGKTTLARRLAGERDAQRFTKDEWVRDLGGDLWDEELLLDAIVFPFLKQRLDCFVHQLFIVFGAGLGARETPAYF